MLSQLYNFRYFFAEIGLIFDMVGVVLIYTFRFQAGPRLEPTSSLLLQSSGKSKGDQEEKRKAKRNKCLSIMGLVLLLVGFALQLISNYLQANP